MPRAGKEDEGVGSRSPLHPGAGAATPPRVVLPAARNENLALARPQRLDLEQLRELQAKVEQDRLLLQQLETLSSRSSEDVAWEEEPDRGAATYTTASTMTKGVSNPQSSIVLARTSRLRRC